MKKFLPKATMSVMLLAMAGTVAAQDNYTLPFDFAASQENFAKCITVDVNGDYNPNNNYGNGGWTYAYPPGAFKYTYHENNQADDWLILPLVDCGNAASVTVSVSVKTGGRDKESFEVYLGTERTVAAMTTKAIEVKDYSNQADWEEISNTVALPAGQGNKWCIGIHASSPAFMFSININKVGMVAASVGPGVGIETIETATEGVAKFYNLQGVEIAEPQQGEIVIMRKGGKTIKAIYK